MVLSKPLSYDSTRHILKHADPNLRILLSMGCPSLRAMEKSLPFKCQKLRCSSDLTSINEVNYEIEMFNGVFRRCLQLTVKYQNRIYTERLKIKTTRSKAHAYLMNFLLGGRSKSIRVKRLEIDTDILRLPELVKFRSREVDIFCTSANGFKRLHEVMDISSFPLNFFGIECINNNWTIFEQPMFRSARRVSIRDYMPGILSWRTFQKIIENWRTTQRDVGTTLTFEDIHKGQVGEILNQIIGQRRYRENENGDLIIPLYQDKELQISCHEELVKGSIFWDDYRNFLKLEVIDVDSD